MQRRARASVAGAAQAVSWTNPLAHLESGVCATGDVAAPLGVRADQLDAHSFGAHANGPYEPLSQGRRVPALSA